MRPPNQTMALILALLVLAWPIVAFVLLNLFLGIGILLCYAFGQPI